MAEKQIDKYPKLEMTVVSVAEEKKLDSGAIKLEFQASIDTEIGIKEVKFFTFSSRLHPTIKESIGKDIACDVEISQREYGDNTYTDRKVTQIYIDGKPVAQAGGGGGGGGGGWKGGGGGGYKEDSPEKIASIEAQTIFNGIIKLLESKVIGMDSELGQAVIVWARAGLLTSTQYRNKRDAGAATPKQESKPEPAPAPKQKAAPPKQAEEDIEDLFPEEPTAPFDRIALSEAMKAAKWNVGTVKSWCKSNLKVTMHGEPLDSDLDIESFVATLSKENIGKLFQTLADKAVS